MPDFGSTLTSGIQEISAFLPLLGTAECEEHVGSALSSGYIYAAATPMSLFGTLGIVKAGIKTLGASLSLPRWGIVGAKKLDDTGFKPSGKTLSLIMMDPESAKRYLAETRFDLVLKRAQIETLRVEDLHRLKIVASSSGWNARLVLLTALSSMAGLTPYVFLNVHDGRHGLDLISRWMFPIARVVGSFLTATTIQFLLEHRLQIILRHRLIFHALNNGEDWSDLQSFSWWSLNNSSESSLLRLHQLLYETSKPSISSRIRKVLKSQHSPEITIIQDPESGGGEPSTPLTPNSVSDQPNLSERSRRKLKAELARANSLLLPGNSHLLAWALHIAIILGIIGSVVGYVGSFSVVQSTSPSDTLAPVIWVLLEGCLSVLRMVFWGWNPENDDSEPMKFLIELDSHPPFSTCDSSATEIFSTKVLPLTPAPIFLRSIRTYIGYLEPLMFSDMTVYYTLTRHTATLPGLNQPALFLTVVDHRDGTTTIYYQDARGRSCYVAATPPDPVSKVLQAQIGDRIDPAQFPALNKFGQLYSLKAHYRVIFQALHYKGRSKLRFASEVQMNWMLSDAPATSPSMKPISGAILPDAGPNDGSDVGQYLIMGALQRKRNVKVSAKRVWLEQYMKEVAIMIQSQLDIWISLARIHYFSRPETQHLSLVRDCNILLEFFELELLFLYEFRTWENRLFQGHDLLLKRIVEQRGELTSGSRIRDLKKTWVEVTLERFKTDQTAADVRMINFRQTFQARLDEEYISAMWSALEMALREDWQGFADDLNNGRPYALPTHTSSALSLYYTPPGLLELASPVCKAIWRLWSNKRVLRLRAEQEDLGNIIRTLEPPREIISTALAITKGTGIRDPRLALSQAKWVSLAPSILDTEDVEFIVESLQRNKWLSYIQFDGVWEDHVLADFVTRLLPKMSPSLTTVAVHHRQRYSATEATILRLISSYPAATYSILLGTEVVDDVLQLSTPVDFNSPDPAVPRVSFNIHGFLVHREDEELGIPSCLTKLHVEANIEIHFWGPDANTSLLLMLYHAFLWFNPSLISLVSIDITTNGQYCQSLWLNPGEQKRDVVTLAPNRDFTCGAWNVITIQTVSSEYQLYDLDLLDDRGILYHPEEIKQPTETEGRQNGWESSVGDTLPAMQTRLSGGAAPEQSSVPPVPQAAWTSPLPVVNVRWGEEIMRQNTYEVPEMPSPYRWGEAPSPGGVSAAPTIEAEPLDITTPEYQASLMAIPTSVRAHPVTLPATTMQPHYAAAFQGISLPWVEHELINNWVSGAPIGQLLNPGLPAESSLYQNSQPMAGTAPLQASVQRSELEPSTLEVLPQANHSGAHTYQDHIMPPPPEPLILELPSEQTNNSPQGSRFRSIAVQVGTFQDVPVLGTLPLPPEDGPPVDLWHPLPSLNQQMEEYDYSRPPTMTNLPEFNHPLPPEGSRSHHYQDQLYTSRDHPVPMMSTQEPPAAMTRSNSWHSDGHITSDTFRHLYRSYEEPWQRLDDLVTQPTMHIPELPEVESPHWSYPENYRDPTTNPGVYQTPVENPGNPSSYSGGLIDIEGEHREDSTRYRVRNPSPLHEVWVPPAGSEQQPEAEEHVAENPRTGELFSQEVPRPGMPQPGSNPPVTRSSGSDDISSISIILDAASTRASGDGQMSRQSSLSERGRRMFNNFYDNVRVLSGGDNLDEIGGSGTSHRSSRNDDEDLPYYTSSRESIYHTGPESARFSTRSESDHSGERAFAETSHQSGSHSWRPVSREDERREEDMEEHIRRQNMIAGREVLSFILDQELPRPGPSALLSQTLPQPSQQRITNWLPALNQGHEYDIDRDSAMSVARPLEPSRRGYVVGSLSRPSSLSPTLERRSSHPESHNLSTTRPAELPGSVVRSTSMRSSLSRRSMDDLFIPPLPPI